jgi:hypothetical protein
LRAGKEIAAAQEVKCVQTFSELSQKHLVRLPLLTGSQTFNPFPCDDRSRSDQRHSSSRPKICTRWSILLLCFFCLPVALIGQAALTSPAPGSALGTSNVTFMWTAGTGVTDYDLWLGTDGPGSSSLYASGWLTTTSTTVPSLPAKAATVYARLYSLVNGAVRYNDYTYTEAAAGTPATMISPTSGSALGTSNVPFTWTAGTGVTDYDLWLGTNGPGSSSLYTSGLTTATSATVTNLPAKGVTVYARLYSISNGVAQSNDYTYTEAAAGTPATMISPTSGSTLGTSQEMFTWTTGTEVTQYDLWLGLGGPGSSSLYTSGWVTSTSVTVPSLQAKGATVYARLYSDVDGVTEYNDYAYIEAGAALLSAFSCTSTSMTGAGTDACTVTLNIAASSGGLTVGLSSNNTAVTVPATVTVAANATSSTFTATVSSVGTAQAATLTASAGGGSKTFALSLNADTPTLTVATSSSPSTYGGPVAFTATISSDPPGTVTFYDGGAVIGTGAINGTTATFTTSSLIAGSQSITASWPGNVNYGAVTSNAIIQMVNKAKPVITWSTPAAITFGTALSNAQLDASSTVPGAFVYSPAAGTVLNAGSQTLSVTFTPTDTTDYTTTTDSLTLTVNVGISTLTVNATSVGFGNVALNQPATQTVTLSSTGTAPVKVNSAVLTGVGFTLSGPTFPETLAPGQTATLNVQFDPTAVGAASGVLSIVSTSSTNGSAAVALTGTGTAASYSVDLSWDAPTGSSDPVAGYNVYSSPSGSSTYTLLNSAVDTLTTYVDSTVQNGDSYDYIVESVDASGVESVPTSPILVTIP